MRISDWSSDVCSSDLKQGMAFADLESRSSDDRIFARAVELEVVARIGDLHAYEVCFIVAARRQATPLVIRERGIGVDEQFGGGPAMQPAIIADHHQIGIAPWRERVCQDVKISVG